MPIIPFDSLDLNPSLQVDSVGSDEAFGLPLFEGVIAPTSINSGEAFDTPTLLYLYAGSGTIYIGSIGQNTPRATLYFPHSFSWDINAAIVSMKSLSWDVGDLPNYWFRVMGDCKPVKCPVGPVEYPQKCDSYFLTMVLANSPKQVCEKLARSNFVWRITEMGRFSTPASNAVADAQDAAGIIDIKCNTLIPVPHCQYKECLPFCLGGEGLDEWGMDMQVVDAFFRYRGTGGMSISGTAFASRPDSIIGSGGITIGGSAGVKSSQYNAAGAGGIIISGDAYVTSTQYNAAGSGGIVIGGVAGATSTRYNAVGSGGMSMDGSCSARVVLTFKSSGLSAIGPSFAGIQISGVVGELAKYYFKTAGLGGINVGGEAHTSSSYFAGVGSGGINMSGFAGTTSPSYHGAGSGGIVIGGEARAKPVNHVVPSGGMSVSGSAMTALRLSYRGRDGVHMGGSGGTNRFAGSGGIQIGGSAFINSTWKGLYVDEWGMEAVCENLEPVFGSGEANTIVPVVTTVTACGATDMPLLLQVSHNLNAADVLKNFMHRNGFVLPDIFDLTYHRVSESWRGNYHYRGRADETTQDRWDFLVEWGCTSDAYGLSNAPVWKFGFQIVRRNEQTGMDFDTRILVYLDPEPLATRFNNDGIDLSIAINPFTRAITVVSANATVQSSAYYDGIGLFTPKLWRKQPFAFRLKAIGEFHKIPRYDLFPIFPKPGEYEVT